MSRHRLTEQRAVTIDGDTRVVTVPAERVRVPTDWDLVWDRTLTAATVLVIVGALAWSVAAIGHLLSAQSSTWLAYTIAGVFDLAWIISTARLYQLRTQPKRQRGPRALSWLLLAVSVAAIFTHGMRVADIAVATFGAAIAVLAKILWHQGMAASHRQLSPEILAHLGDSLGEAEGAVEIIRFQRRVNRERGRAAMLAAHDTPPTHTTHAPVHTGVSTGATGLHLVGSTGDTGPTAIPAGGKRKALFKILDGLPDDDGRNIAQLATAYGPRVGMTSGAARNAISEWQSRRRLAQAGTDAATGTGSDG